MTDTNDQTRQPSPAKDLRELETLARRLRQDARRLPTCGQATASQRARPRLRIRWRRPWVSALAVTMLAVVGSSFFAPSGATSDKRPAFEAVTNTSGDADLEIHSLSAPEAEAILDLLQEDSQESISISI